jgi:hypothetical protein
MYEQFKLGVLKMRFGEMKIGFLATALIHIVWYIRDIFDCLEYSNFFSFQIWSTFVFFLFVSKAITTQISINLLESSRSQAGLVSEIVTQPSFSSWIIDK